MLHSFQGYRILNKLGEGGMGAVYLVEDDGGTRYALKTVKPEIAGDEEFRQRFLRESRIAMRLKHERIVETYDGGEGESGILYLLTEFCPNGDMDNWMQNHGSAPLQLALQWTFDTALALQHLDVNNVIHRDLKPQNLLLDGGRRIKLTDVGCARRTTADATRLTEDGSIQGTPYYLSPEQAMGRDDLDIRSDIYSLGVTLYQLLSGKYLFTGNTVAQILIKHLKEQPVPITEYRPGIPPHIAEFVHSMLRKDRENRPRDAKELTDRILTIAMQAGLDIYELPIPESEYERLCGEIPEAGGEAGKAAQTEPAAESAGFAETIKYNENDGADTPPAGVDYTEATIRYDDEDNPALSAVECKNLNASADPSLPADSGDGMMTLESIPFDDLAETLTAGNTPVGGVAAMAAAPGPENLEFLQPAAGITWKTDRAWLAVSLEGHAVQILVYTRFPVNFGRKRNEEVGICTRLYPVDRRRNEIMRISNNHGEFGFDNNTWTVKDNDSREGIELEGIRLQRGVPAPMPDKSTVNLAGVLAFESFSLRERIGAPPDALAVYRPENRPELAAVLLRSSVVIGGQNREAALVTPEKQGVLKETLGRLIYRESGFWWNPAAPVELPGRGVVGESQAVLLEPGMIWSAAGRLIGIREFSYDVFK